MTTTSTISPGTADVTQELTAQDREQARLLLMQTQNGVVGAIKGMTAAQWQFQPEPDCWSTAQIVEHVIFVLDRVGGPLQDVLAQAPPPPADRNCQEVDSIVIYQFPVRLKKFASPEVARPSGSLASPAEALERVRQGYSRLAEHLENTPGLRDHAMEAPPLKAVTQGTHTVMDGYQWILAAATHTERHTKQILEWKANENFPAH